MRLFDYYIHLFTKIYSDSTFYVQFHYRIWGSSSELNCVFATVDNRQLILINQLFQLILPIFAEKSKLFNSSRMQEWFAYFPYGIDDEALSDEY